MAHTCVLPAPCQFDPWPIEIYQENCTDSTGSIRWLVLILDLPWNQPNVNAPPTWFEQSIGSDSGLIRLLWQSAQFPNRQVVAECLHHQQLQYLKLVLPTVALKAQSLHKWYLNTYMIVQQENIFLAKQTVVWMQHWNYVRKKCNKRLDNILIAQIRLTTLQILSCIWLNEV